MSADQVYALPTPPFQMYALPKFQFRCMHFRNNISDVCTSDMIVSHVCTSEICLQMYALPKYDFRCMHFRHHFFSCMHLLLGFIQMYALSEFLAYSPLNVSFPLF